MSAEGFSRGGGLGRRHRDGEAISCLWKTCGAEANREANWEVRMHHHAPSRAPWRWGDAMAVVVAVPAAVATLVRRRTVLPRGTRRPKMQTPARVREVEAVREGKSPGKLPIPRPDATTRSNWATGRNLS